MGNIRSLFLFFSFIAAFLCSAQDLKHYELDVKDFNNLDVVDGFNVVYHTSNDTIGVAMFETIPLIADKILFENNNKGKLSIKKGFYEEGQLPDGLPVIHVYSRFLKEVRNSADSLVRIASFRPTMEFKATVIGNGRIVARGINCSKFSGALKTGSGTIVAAGTCETASLSVLGTGAVQADDLKAQNVSANLLGTGTIGCYPVEDLLIKGIKGKIYFRGKPAKIRNHSVGVKIFTIDGLEWKPTKND